MYAFLSRDVSRQHPNKMFSSCSTVYIVLSSISIQYLLILVSTFIQMPLNSNHLVGMSGKVLRIANNSKAVITFNKDGRDETAILLGKSPFKYFLAPRAFLLSFAVQKLYWLGNKLSEHRIISDFLRPGDRLTFDCHVNSGG